MKTVPTLHSQRDGPFPVKPKRKNWRSANIILLVKTWNMLKLSLNFHRKVLPGTVLLIELATTSVQVQSSLVSGSCNQ